MHLQTEQRTIWAACGWHKVLQREVQIGYVVTDGKSNPVAFVRGAGKVYFDLASHISQSENWADACKHFYSGFAEGKSHLLIDLRTHRDKVRGWILYPMRSDGSRMKSKSQQFPAAQYVGQMGTSGLCVSLRRFTADGLRMAQDQQKSGYQPTPEAAQPTSKSSKRKQLVTAA